MSRSRIGEGETILESSMLRDAGSCATPISNWTHYRLLPLYPMTSGRRLELADELLKSLIKGKFFRITPARLYPGY